ncbi:hypothetical protein SAMN02910265_01826 [Ruminococcus flavefaciens]|uniref:Uncharacterized protein n=1 Tax=Ruminococcus flavefaciens TaxID=1265 RepID=A0A1H6JNF7_RUMFL|nr:hypothetical protein [Ruminococcus flavefaciens]SEH62408.1 hypothetical protein SAMN02910265_01826 [Ruminococcus flavefaciens]
MREYDKKTLKIAERIFEKGDEILEQRQKKAAKIRHISYAVSGLCAVLIVCFGVWKILPSINKPDGSFKDTGTVITTEAATDTVTTAFTTTENTTVTEAANAVATIKTTAESTETAAAVTVRTSANGITPVRTTTVNNTVTRRTTAKATAKITHTTVYTHTTVNQVSSTTAWSGEEIAHMTTSRVNERLEEWWTTVKTTIADIPVGPVTTKKTSANVTIISTVSTRVTEEPVIKPVTTSTSVMPTDINSLFKLYPVSVSLDNVRYDKGTAESNPTSAVEIKIGDFIRKARVTIYITNKNKIVQTMEVYEIKGRSSEQAVAVRLTDTDEYFEFRNYNYRKEDDGL